VARARHAVLLKQAEKAKAMSCESSLNILHGEGPFGIAASGMAYNYVKDAVKDLGLENRTRIFKLGFSFPFPDTPALDFIRSSEKILVVEELEPLIEDTLKALAHTHGSTTPIAGKGPDLFSRLYEYQPGLVREVIARYFDVDYTPPRPLDCGEGSAPVQLPVRPPNLCAGCPHRASYYAVNSVLKEMESEAIFPTDIGCYTLGLLPPLQTADFVICMGSSVSSAAGFSRATAKTVIAFIGDSTFFHSGITGLINAVHNNHKFVLIILDNGTTAMTGHQPHPGVELAPPGWDKPCVSIESVVKGCGVEHVAVVNPINLAKMKGAVKEAISAQQLSVIIAKAPCPLYERRILGTKPKRRFVVGPECNTDCTACVDTLGCPALYRNTAPDAETTMVIDERLCIGCGVCIQVCKKIRPKKG
jgi:indolepyruvate ferredoxin oxidoreductase alpha subunit